MKYLVGLIDANGIMCWLAGYGSDPDRYYNVNVALTFSTKREAQEAVENARLTHPGKQRAYKIVTITEPKP